jgi:hypothetical protein
VWWSPRPPPPIGAALAWAITRGIVAAMPREGAGAVPRADEIGLDARAFGVAVAAALVAGVLSAFVPAIGAARTDLRTALAAGGARGASAGAGARRALEGLVVAQIALGVVLAAGAGWSRRVSPACAPRTRASAPSR